METQGMSPASPRGRTQTWRMLAHFCVPLATIVVCLLAISSKGLLELRLGGLDEAHHVMDGIFFRDLYTDLPLSGLRDYVFGYYQQYPALGFIFWPPFFPAVEGVVFKLAGINLLNAQVSVLLFGFILAISFYRILRRSLDHTVATLGAVLLISTPGLYSYFNVVMLEIPVLAMMALTVVVYLRTVEHGTHGNWQLLAVVAALSLYTKQTAFIMVPAIACDLLLNRRKLLQTTAPWFGLATAVLLTLPLALFTLKFGKANLEQSIGSGTQQIMSSYAGPSRWTLEGWSYYIKTLPSTFHIGILASLLLFLFLCIRHRELLKDNIIFLAWLLGFYLVFSYFDNKAERFATLIVIPVTALAIRALSLVPIPVRPLRKYGAHVLTGLLSIASLATVSSRELVRMQGLDEIMSQIDVAGTDGNFVYFGDYRQPFVYQIRARDFQRSHYVLQGDDIFNGAAAPEQLLKEYRIRYILAEPDNLSSRDAISISAIKATHGVEKIFAGTFHVNNIPQRIVIYRNDNTLAQKMHPIRLSSSLIDNN